MPNSKQEPEWRGPRGAGACSVSREKYQQCWQYVRTVQERSPEPHTLASLPFDPPPVPRPPTTTTTRWQSAKQAITQTVSLPTAQSAARTVRVPAFQGRAACPLLLGRRSPSEHGRRVRARVAATTLTRRRGSSGLRVRTIGWIGSLDLRAQQPATLYVPLGDGRRNRRSRTARSSTSGRRRRVSVFVFFRGPAWARFAARPLVVVPAGGQLGLLGEWECRQRGGKSRTS